MIEYIVISDDPMVGGLITEVFNTFDKMEEAIEDAQRRGVYLYAMTTCRYGA